MQPLQVSQAFAWLEGVEARVYMQCTNSDGIASSRGEQAGCRKDGDRQMLRNFFRRWSPAIDVRDGRSTVALMTFCGN